MDYLTRFAQDSKQIVGARIRQCRTSMNSKMSAGDLADSVAALNLDGITPSDRTITKYETGINAAPLPVLMALAKIFDCDVTWLAGLTKEIAPAPSLAKIPYYQANGNQSLTHLTFKKSWLDAKNVQADKLVLVVAENEESRKTYLINKQQNTLDSEGYYGLVVNGKCITRYIRLKLSGAIAVYSDSRQTTPLEEFTPEQAANLNNSLTVLGRAFWVATDL